jgi:hypothetical protein
VPTAPEGPILSVQLDPATVDLLADAIAVRVAELLPDRVEDRWLDSAEAADHLRLPLSQLRKLSAADLIPARQDTPGGRLYFLRSELDEWRRSNPAAR